jgi:hypothetical protein
MTDQRDAEGPGDGSPRRTRKRTSAAATTTGAAATSRRTRAEPRLDDLGEWWSGPAAGTALVSSATFEGKGLVYAEVEGLAVFEGDIVLGRADELSAQAEAPEVGSRSIGVTGARFRWPGAKVGYAIAGSLPNQARVTDAIAHWEAKTRIRFTLRTAANASSLRDYITFQPSGGCSSSVGRQGGEQFVNLGPSCTTGNCIHEIGHALGLWHEQSREDRDRFVRVIWAKIDPAKQHNFTQHVSDGDDLGGYDYGSIMHYPLTAFSIDGSPTLQVLGTVPAGTTVGQRSALSDGDVAGIHAMYPAAPVTVGSGKARRDATKTALTDRTRKEIVKDPIFDAGKGRKESVLDQIRIPFPGFGRLTRQVPFLLGAPSGFPDEESGDATAVAEQLAFLGEAVTAVAEQQAALAEQLAALAEQQAAVVEAYEATVAALQQ